MLRVAPLAAVLAVACGGAGERVTTRADDSPVRTVPLLTDGTGDEGIRVAPGVPREATGPVAPRAAHVVRAWAADELRGRTGAAAARFAVPARVQNAGAVEVLRTRGAVRAWNAKLPCGAVLLELGGARGYAIAEFRLIHRRGADCGSSFGRHARVAFRVEDGRITAWHLLPNVASGPRPEPGETSPGGSPA